MKSVNYSGVFVIAEHKTRDIIRHAYLVCGFQRADLFSVCSLECLDLSRMCSLQSVRVGTDTRFGGSHFSIVLALKCLQFGFQLIHACVMLLLQFGCFSTVRGTDIFHSHLVLSLDLLFQFGQSVFVLLLKRLDRTRFSTCTLVELSGMSCQGLVQFLGVTFTQFSLDPKSKPVSKSFDTFYNMTRHQMYRSATCLNTSTFSLTSSIFCSNILLSSSISSPCSVSRRVSSS